MKLYKALCGLFVCALLALVVDSRRAEACTPSLLVYRATGRLVVPNPKVYLVLWGFGTPINDPSAEVPWITNVIQGFPAWHWTSTDTQYYQTVGSTTTYISNLPTEFGAVIIDNNAGHVLPPDTQPQSTNCPLCTGTSLGTWRTAIANEALAMSATFDQSSSAIYVVMTPKRTFQLEQMSVANGGASACAWHGSVAIPGAGRFLPFADLPYQTSVQCYSPTDLVGNATAVTIHEIEEAITDPFYDQGQPAWEAVTCGSEIGDYCGSFTYQKILPDSITPNRLALPALESAAANNGNGACVSSYTKNSSRFYISDYGGNPGYMYTSLSGTGCGSSRIWWAGVPLVNKVASTSWGPDRLDLFAFDTNNHLQHLYSNDAGWDMYVNDWGVPPSGWNWLGMPAAASWGPSHLDVFALASNGSTVNLMHRLWNQNADNSITDTGWENIGAPPTDTLYYTGDVTAVSDGEPYRVDAFLFSTNSAYNLNLWQASRVGSSGAWTWQNNGNPGTSVPLTGLLSAASWGPQRWDVFVEDYSANSVLWHFSETATGTAWESWGTLPQASGMNSYEPSAIAMGDNRLDVYVQGTDWNIYQRTFDYGDKGWSASIGCQNVPYRNVTLQGVPFY